MNDITLSYREFFLYAVIIGAVVGTLVGLAPLLLGRRNNQARLGMYGFLASIISGVIHPLLALVVAGIFSFLIIRKKADTLDTGSATANDDTSDRAAG